VPLKPSFLAEEPRLPLPFWPRRPGGRLPRLVLLVEPAVDEGPDQGAGRNAASEALAPQARVDSFFEAHRQRLSQGSHLRPQPYTSRPPPATDRSSLTRYPADGDGLRPSWLRAIRGAAHENLGVVWSGSGVLRKPGPCRNLRGALGSASCKRAPDGHLIKVARHTELTLGISRKRYTRQELLQ
jgi:hypothetical protein